MSERTKDSGSTIELEESWKELLLDEFQLPYMKSLKDFLLEEKKKAKIIFPRGKDIFNCFQYTPLSELKVVILGQDPYHGQGQAHGLSFSVRQGVTKPPSLVNLFKEIKEDLGIAISDNGDLSCWAKQGVLLLNSVLTVESNKPASHRNKGWETFTDRVVAIINQHKTNVVFMLWGSYAQQKGCKIDTKKHLVLKSSHPSPFSYLRSFKGCKHFSKANKYMLKHHKQAIDWNLSPL